ncbi:phage holin family protein [Chloroflexota bacterium]
MKLILRLIINAIAIAITIAILPALGSTGDLVGLLIFAVVLGLINAFIRPLVKLLTLPITVMTLGLFSLVINGLMLWLASLLTSFMTIEGGILNQWLWAIIGSIVISIISTVLSWFLPDND